MKHLYYYYFFLFLLLPFFSKAQSNYKPGYIVILNGDTIRGYIDYREWEANPKQFTFKKSQNATIEKYSVNNCNAFGIDGFEYFQKFTVSVSQNPIDPVKLNNPPDTSSIIETVFLRTITKGKLMSLYSLTDHIKGHIYIAENNQNPVELILRLQLNNTDNIGYTTQAIYKHQLQRMAYNYQPDNKKLAMEINSANYDVRDIRPIVDKINGPGNYTQTATTNMLGIGLFAGISLVNTQTKVEGAFDFAGQSYNSLSPTVDVGIDLLQNKNIGNLLLRVDLGFTGSKANFTQYSHGNSTTPNVSKLSFNQHIVYLNPQILYNFYNTKPLKFYAAAGVVIDYSIFTNKSYTVAFGGEAPTDLTATNFPYMNSFYFTLSGKIGIILNDNIDIHMGYWLPYDVNNNVSYNSPYDIKTSQYSLGISYLFGAK